MERHKDAQINVNQHRNKRKEKARKKGKKGKC